MSPWPDPLLILTAALTLAAVLLLLNAAHARWRRLCAPRRHASFRGYVTTPKPPAPEPPVPPPVSGPGRSPGRSGPAPGLRKRIDVLFCGCTYIYDGAEQEWNVITCGGEGTDWDAALRRLTP